MTPSPKLPADGAARLQALLDQQTSSGRVPSAFLTVVTPSEVLFTGASGKYDPVDPETRKASVDDTMWFASTTKLITSVCYLQLVDRGVLSLDTDLTERFPPLAAASKRIWGGLNEAGEEQWTDNKTPITLRMMLNQSSGFGAEFGPKVQQWKEKVAVEGKGKGFVNSCKVDNLIHTPITFEPGTWYEYGNSAEWLALMLPTFINEQSYEDYLQANICKPLGLSNTTFYPFEGEIAKRLLPCRYGAGAETRTDGQYEWKVLESVKGMLAEGLCLPRSKAEIEYPAGGGGIYSSTTNYATLLQHLLSHYLSLSHTTSNPSSSSSVHPSSSPLLSDKSVRSLFSGTLDPRAYQPIADGLNRIRGFKGNDQVQAGEADWTTGMALYNPKDEDKRRGGWGRKKGSVGWGGAAGTEYWIDPKSQIAVVWTTQMLPVGCPVVAESKLEVEKLVYELLGV